MKSLNLTAGIKPTETPSGKYIRGMKDLYFKEIGEKETEEADFEIIEPKQLPPTESGTNIHS